LRQDFLGFLGPQESPSTELAGEAVPGEAVPVEEDSKEHRDNLFLKLILALRAAGEGSFLGVVPDS